MTPASEKYTAASALIMVQEGARGLEEALAALQAENDDLRDQIVNWGEASDRQAELIRALWRDTNKHEVGHERAYSEGYDRGYTDGWEDATGFCTHRNELGE